MRDVWSQVGGNSIYTPLVPQRLRYFVRHHFRAEGKADANLSCYVVSPLALGRQKVWCANCPQAEVNDAILVRKMGYLCHHLVSVVIDGTG